MNMHAHLRHFAASPASSRSAGGLARAALQDGCVVTARLADEPHGKGIRCRLLASDGLTEQFEVLIEIANLDYSQPPRLTALAEGGFRLGWVERSAEGPRIQSEEFRPIG